MKRHPANPLITPEMVRPSSPGFRVCGVYRLFTLLLDLNNPARVLKRASRPMLEPEADYETKGFFGRVVFTNGAVQFEDGRVWIYYGAADRTTCLAESSIDELLASR